MRAQVLLVAPDRPGGSLEMRQHAHPWRHALHPDEMAVCVSHVPLQTPLGLQHLFAVGTAVMLGEDHPCTGRLLLIQAGMEDRAGSSMAVGNVVHVRYAHTPSQLLLPCTPYVVLHLAIIVQPGLPIARC